MAILVRNIKLTLDQSDDVAFEQALDKAGMNRGQVDEMSIVKSSVDARRRDRICLVCSVEINLADPGGEESIVAAAASGDVVCLHNAPLDIRRGTVKLEYRPVVVGFGPAGMFAALLLARQGYRPLVLERGGNVERRTVAVESFWSGGALDFRCNVQFGEGGAGTFSDGKLTTRINDPLCALVLEEMVRFGAPAELRRKAKPHIGTDHLRRVVKAIREEIIALGGEVRFDSCVEDMTLRGGRLIALRAGGREELVQAVLLAPGHSARDTFELLLARGIGLVAKPFSVGVRVEHLQSEIDRALYGTAAGHPRLPRGEYQLSHREGRRAVYTFCMCPGGFVVPAASEEGGVVVNGMSRYARDAQNSNAALVVSVDTADFGGGVLDGMAFQRALEQRAYQAGGGGYRAPVQNAGLFLQGKGGFTPGRVTPSYAIGTAPADLGGLFPTAVTEMLTAGLRRFDGMLRGFAAADTVLTGVETRTSSPVRIPRGEDMQSPDAWGLYPCGEGAGYAGGIMSAAVDGMKAALAVMAEYAPME